MFCEGLLKSGAGSVPSATARSEGSPQMLWLALFIVWPAALTLDVAVAAH